MPHRLTGAFSMGRHAQTQYLLYFLLAESVICLEGNQLSETFLIRREELNTVTATYLTNDTSYVNHEVSFGWEVDTSVTAVKRTVIDSRGTSYGPSEWTIVENELSEWNGWTVQKSNIRQLVVNPITLAIAQSSYRGTHLALSVESSSNFVMEVNIRSQTPIDVQPESTGISWRFLDNQNHYVLVTNAHCGISKLVRMANGNPNTISHGASTLVHNFNFGESGNYPDVNNNDEYAYVKGLLLTTCMGNCQADSDCVGSLRCHVIQHSHDVKVPGCVGKGTLDWGYCILNDARPAFEAPFENFPRFDSSNSLNGGLDMTQCQGDCDYDFECLGNLKCLFRERFTKVTGCGGEPEPYWDYCGYEEGPVSFVRRAGPVYYNEHDGYVLEILNKDSLKTSSYVLHVDSKSLCPSDEDTDALEGTYLICGWVKVSMNYNGIAQVLASVFWGKTGVVGYTSTLNHCLEDETCQHQTNSLVPFQFRDKWHHVCDEFESSTEKIYSLDVYIGYPTRASQGYMHVTGITVKRFPVGSLSDGATPHLLKTPMTDFTYKVRITHIDDNIRVAWNGQSYMDTYFSDPLGPTPGIVSFFTGGNPETGFSDFRFFPVQGSKTFSANRSASFRFPLVNLSDVNDTRVPGNSLLFLVKSCPPLGSSMSCTAMQQYSTQPPPTPRLLDLYIIREDNILRATYRVPEDDGGSVITHFHISYNSRNDTMVGQKLILQKNISMHEKLVSFNLNMPRTTSMMYTVDASMCTIMGCGKTLSSSISSPSEPQNVSLEISSDTEFTVTFGLPKQDGGLPVTFYMFTPFLTKYRRSFYLCTSLSTPAPQPTWRVTWLDGEPSIHPNRVDGNNGMQTITVRSYDSWGKQDYTNHIIPGPDGRPNSAIDTNFGSNAQVNYPNADGDHRGYRFKESGEVTIDAVVRGPLANHGDWHAISRGLHRDAHVMYHPNTHHDYKLGVYKDSNPKHGFNTILPTTRVTELFEGDEAGEWKHLTVVEREGSIYMYLDGILLGSTPTTFSRPLGGIWSIGALHHHAWKWGPIAEFSFWDRSLTEDEITVLSCANNFQTSYNMTTSNTDKDVLESSSIPVPTKKNLLLNAYTVAVQACNEIGCSASAQVETSVPHSPVKVRLQISPLLTDVLNVSVLDGWDGGMPITSYRVEFAKQTMQIHIACDDFTGGLSCTPTRRSTDDNTCKQNGLDIVVPRSKKHWEYLKNQFPDYLTGIVPGITKDFSGHSYTSYAFNSEDLPPNTWKGIDGGPFWVRDTSFGEPNGDYHANCWLGGLNTNDLDNIHFNDHNCNYETSKYICSNNVPKRFIPPSFAGDVELEYEITNTFIVNRSEISNGLHVEESSSIPFRVRIYPCNRLGCSKSFGQAKTTYPPAPERVAIRILGPSELSLDLVPSPLLNNTEGVSFEITASNVIWLDNIFVPSDWFSINFLDGDVNVGSESSPDSLPIAATLTKPMSICRSLYCSVRSVVAGPNSDNILSGVVNSAGKSIVKLSEDGAEGVTLGIEWSATLWIKQSEGGNVPVVLLGGAKNPNRVKAGYKDLGCRHGHHFHHRSDYSFDAQGLSECINRCRVENFELFALDCLQNDPSKFRCFCSYGRHGIHVQDIHPPEFSYPNGEDPTNCDIHHYEANLACRNDYHRCPELFTGDNADLSELQRSALSTTVCQDYTQYISGTGSLTESGVPVKISGNRHRRHAYRFERDAIETRIDVGPTNSPLTLMLPPGTAPDAKVDNKELGFWSNANQMFYSSGIKSNVFTGEWQSLGVVAANNTQKFYLDGKLIGVTQRAFSGKIYSIGGVIDAKSWGFWQSIGQVRFWSSSLTKIQIQSSTNLPLRQTEQNIVDAGVTSLRLTNQLITQHPVQIQVHCRTNLGKSVLATSDFLFEPDIPSSLSVRVINSDHVQLLIGYPNNDNGAEVTQWKVVLEPSSSNDTHFQLNYTPSAINLHRANIGARPRAFKVYSCSSIGCSYTPRIAYIQVPGAPGIFNIVNHDDGDKFEITVGLPENDGGADIFFYKFISTCYLSGGSTSSINSTQLLSDLTPLPESIYMSSVMSPLPSGQAVNDHTCKVESHACSPVGCSLDIATSWNIGLNSETTASLIGVLAPNNITLEFSSTSEPRKDINPKKTELRWIHYVTEETYLTTQEIEYGVSQLSGTFPMAYDFSSTRKRSTALNVFLAGNLLHYIQRRHCYDTLCGRWKSILSVFPGPSPGVPTCYSSNGDCFKMSSSRSGGNIYIEWGAPPYWGHNSFKNGRSYRVNVMYCDHVEDSPLGTEDEDCVYTEFSPPRTYQTKNLYFTVPDLLHVQRYKFYINAMNGQVFGGDSQVSKSISPEKNKPAKPDAPKVIVTNPESVTIELELPSMHGSAIYDCDMIFAVVGDCGVDASVFDDYRPFPIGNKHTTDADYLYNLGLMYEVGTGAMLDLERAKRYYQTAAELGHKDALQKIGFFNGDLVSSVDGIPFVPVPPMPRSRHVVTIGDLNDDTVYSAKLQCYNDMGIGAMSEYSKVFHTPKIVTARNISIVPFLVPTATIENWSKRKEATFSFFNRFPLTVQGVTYTKDAFCLTHPNLCLDYPFSSILTPFNDTEGHLVEAGWYFGQGDDRYCKREFPLAICRSLGQAIRATSFEGVKFYIGKGVYRHLSNYTNRAGKVQTQLDVEENIISWNSTNSSNRTKPLPIVHYGETFPITFPYVGAHLLAMDNLKPSDVVINCDGKICFDFSPALNNHDSHPFVELRGLTVTGGRSGQTGGSAIYAPNLQMKEWKYQGVLKSVIVIQSCIFNNHSTLGDGGVMHVTSETVVQNWEIHDSTFYDNKAFGSGGAIKIDSSVIVLSRVRFEKNIAVNNGGVLRATSSFVGSAIRALHLSLNNNFAGNGGGVFSVLGANIDVRNQTNATSNVAQGEDGGGFLIAEASTVKILKSTLGHMQATTSNGGAFNVMGSIVYITEVNITDVFAKTKGGAVVSQLSTLRLHNVRITRAILSGAAKEKASGGAVALLIRSRLVLSDSTFEANLAAFAGGAISCNDCSSVKIQNVEFRDNLSGRGGALAIFGSNGGKPLSIDSGTFLNNQARVAGGGAIFWEQWPPPNLEGSPASYSHVGSIINRAYKGLILQEGNRALYGDFIASGPSYIHFEQNTIKFARNTEPFGPHVTLRDNYTSQIIDRDEGISIKLLASSETAPLLKTSNDENIALVSTEGNASFPDFGIAGEPSSMRLSSSPHTVIVTASESSVRPVTFVVSVRDCLPGEYLSKLGNVYACTQCQAGRYDTKINTLECTVCQEGRYQEEVGMIQCKKCPSGLFQSRTGQTACGEPDVISWYPVIKNLTRSRNISNDHMFLLTWSWPQEAEDLELSKPMVEVATRPDFADGFTGDEQNMTIEIDYKSKASAVVFLPRPVYDMVIYARIRINSGTAVGPWAALLDPWEITLDCTDDEFLNDLGTRYPFPDKWFCEKCPNGGQCVGNIRWGQVYAKFGYWRVDAVKMDEHDNEVDDPSIPDMFQQCFFEAACLGAANTEFAGKFYNSSSMEDNSEGMEDLALSDNGERCNWEWGHAQMCTEYGNPDKVRCRLCQRCRQGYKSQGRSRCRVCPEATANRILLGVGALAVVVGFVTVVSVSINSAGTEAELSESVKKVFINYMQICSLAALFPLKWPPAIEAIFAMMSAVSSPAQHILSPDCELSWMSAAEVFYNKQVGYGLMPIIVVLLCQVVWIAGYVFHGKKLGRTFAYYYDRIVLTIVCILFLLYPTMVKQSLGGLACDRVGAEYYLSVDLQEACYETRHLWYVLTLTIPQILLYTIGLPMGAIVVLYKNRFRLQSNRRVQFRYGILYNGYRPRLWWWELTIAFRKVALVLIAGVFGVRLGPDMQVTVALLLIMLFITSHLAFSPFTPHDERLLPEIPVHILERRYRMKMALRKEKKQRKKRKKKGETLNDNEKESDRINKLSNAEMKPPFWRKVYYSFVGHTNMHMLEFASLGICGLTLWSGLVFFLNDVNPRMSRTWVEAFSILVAIINILTILWMIYKYVEAVAREMHTRSTISVWVDHTFSSNTPNTKKQETRVNKKWRHGLKRAKTRNIRLKVDSQQNNKTDSLETDSKGASPRRSQRRMRRWSTLNHDKVSVMAKYENIMNDHSQSESRKNKEMESYYRKAQQRLKRRLTNKYGKSAPKLNTKTYREVAQSHITTKRVGVIEQKESNGLSKSHKMASHASTHSEDLPEGWQELTHPTTGDKYYLNTHTRKTTWEKPGPKLNGLKTDESTHSKDLPEGWQELTHPTTGDKYYLNIHTRKTTWEKPAPKQNRLKNDEIRHKQPENSQVNLRAQEIANWTINDNG